MHLRAYTRRGTRYKLSAYFNAAVQAIGTHKERETAPECGHTCKRILGANRTCPTRKMSVCSMLHPIYKYFFFSRSYSFILFQSRCCLCVCVWSVAVCISYPFFIIILGEDKAPLLCAETLFFGWCFFPAPACACRGGQFLLFHAKMRNVWKKPRIICRAVFLFLFTSFVLHSFCVCVCVWCAAKLEYFLVIIERIWAIGYCIRWLDAGRLTGGEMRRVKMALKTQPLSGHILHFLFVIKSLFSARKRHCNHY